MAEPQAEDVNSFPQFLGMTSELVHDLQLELRGTTYSAEKLAYWIEVGRHFALLGYG